MTANMNRLAPAEERIIGPKNGTTCVSPASIQHFTFAWASKHIGRLSPPTSFSRQSSCGKFILCMPAAWRPLICTKGTEGHAPARSPSALTVEDLQIRQGHWAIVDLVGKGGHVRPVPVPAWVKQAIDRWRDLAKVGAGRIFRAVSRHGTSWGKGISENVIWYVVRRCAERMQLDHLAPHDLRRTCAKLCH